MISRTTKQFWKLYNALPPDVQKRADKAYELWLSQPSNPGLQFKRVDPEDPIYSVRIGLNYRALGILSGDTITWFWVGKHDIYDRILR
ncbi:MAG: type II toxin-antitoxin system RelE family toxin [bacterium]